MRACHPCVESRLQALGLLASRLEQVFTSSMRTPFLALKNIPLGEAERERLDRLKETFPEVVQVFFLDAEMRLRLSYPHPSNEHSRQVERWIIERLNVEGQPSQAKPFTLHSFIETIDGKPTLFALQPVNDIDYSDGWLLIRFDLDLLTQRAAPLLAEFGTNQEGTVRLQDPEEEWDDSATNWLLNRVLPGWTLSFKPSAQAIEGRVWRNTIPMLGIGAGVVLAIAMATFSVWREIRREHAVVDLCKQFVANVSHELKTPLALIRMYAETLHLRRVADEERRHRYYDTILREAERLTDMINNVLDFARLTEGVKLYELTERDLAATVSDVLADYGMRIDERGLRRDVILAADLPPVAHDRNGVMQILINLLDNAIKYGADGGFVRVELCAAADQVELAVTDGGPGIPPAERAQLRKAFHQGTGSDPRGGSGLGLALVDQIAAAHGARFSLDTPPDGRGMRACVSFPICKEA